MKIQKYRASTSKEAFALARAELGEEAVLLHQRTVQGERGRFVEVTVAVDAPPEPPPAEEPPVIRPFFAQAGGSAAESVPAGRIRARPNDPRPERRSVRQQQTSPNDPHAAQENADALWREIRYIRALLQRQSQESGLLPASLGRWRAALTEALLPAALVDDLLAGLEEVLTPAALERPALVAATLAQRLAARMMPARGALQPGTPGDPLVFVLVGPTGVGKTTTLAKLAARFSVQHRLPVALITADTFRVGAVGQLRTYSDLIRAPLEVAYTPDELAGHVARHQDKAVIFVDTPGRSPSDTEQLAVLRSFVDVLPDPHLQIAVAAGTLLADARRIVERFSVAAPSGILLTKLDETTLFGPSCALLAELELPLSYFTTGQRVPEDIEIASNETLVDQLLQKARANLDAVQTLPGAVGLRGATQAAMQQVTAAV